MINDCDEVVAIFTSSTKTSDTPDPPGRAGPPRPADLSPAAWMVQAWMSQLSLDLFFAHIDCALRRGRPTSLTSKINKRHFFFCPLSRRWRQVGGPRRVSPTILPPTSDLRPPTSDLRPPTRRMRPADPSPTVERSVKKYGGHYGGTVFF